MNIFEQASRQALRFPTIKGMLSVEDLWNLPLLAKAANSVDLNTVAKDTNKDLQKVSEENFVTEDAKADPAKARLALSLEIVKHVIAVKQEEAATAKSAKAKADEKALLLDILAGKQADALKGLSVEEIQKKIAAL